MHSVDRMGQFSTVRIKNNDFIKRMKKQNMATKQLKAYTLAHMKDKYIGKTGSKEHDDYEYELRMDILDKMIKAARKERKLTQEELGRPVGEQKAQISKLKSSVNSATIDTILRVFKALKAEINFQVKIEGNVVALSGKAERITQAVGQNTRKTNSQKSQSSRIA